ncbi:MAG: tetratricopeptide repeat protein [Treponema sp.]|nr:tetratricopeptide repeat protein [Treponema sp.]
MTPGKPSKTCPAPSLLDLDNEEAYYQRGLAYSLLRETDKARSDYEQTIALAPDHEKAAAKLNEL